MPKALIYLGLRNNSGRPDRTDCRMKFHSKTSARWQASLQMGAKWRQKRIANFLSPKQRIYRSRWYATIS